MNEFQQAKRIVVKVGSSTLTYPTGGMNLRRIEELSKVISDLKNQGRKVVLVSSGAIAAGMGQLGFAQRPTDIASKQAAASVGQCSLMYLYDKFFSEYGHTVSQVLLTGDAVEHEERRQNVHNTFQRLLELGVVPIVNENDTVAVDEIRFGDNDNLSATVALLVEADVLVLVSDIDGLYTGNPRENPDARLIPRVEEITDSLMEIAGGSGSNRGTGGMATKLAAARKVTQAGIAMAIVNGANLSNLSRLFDGETVGTYFVARK